MCYGHLWLQRKFLLHTSPPNPPNPPNTLVGSRLGETVNVFALQWQLMLLPAQRLEPR